MNTGKFLARPATEEDGETVIALMRELYAEDDIAFVEERARRSIHELIRKPEHGVILLFSRVESGVEQEPCGYAVLTLGFTLEHGGSFVLLDELYLQKSARGLGLGREALALAKDWALRRGVEALRLEVHRHNAYAKSVYLKNGFIDDHRDILTLWLNEG